MTGEDNSNWEQHGGLRTLVSYKHKIQADKDIHLLFSKDEVLSHRL